MTPNVLTDILVFMGLLLKANMGKEWYRNFMILKVVSKRKICNILIENWSSWNWSWLKDKISTSFASITHFTWIKNWILYLHLPNLKSWQLFSSLFKMIMIYYFNISLWQCNIKDLGKWGCSCQNVVKLL